MKMKKVVTSLIVALILLFVTQVSVKAVYITFYDENGGTEVGHMEHVNGTVTITVDDQTREGYDFLGWASDDENITIDGSELTSAYPQGYRTPTSVYGTWGETVYNIEYDLDGGVAEDNPDSYTMFSEDITLNNPTKEGFEFVGWTNEDEEELGTEVVIPSGSEGDRIFIALWNPIVYNIEYDLDGGVAENNPETYTAEDTFTLNNPTKEGFKFVGWTDAEGNDLGTEVTIPEGTIGDLKFIAKWEAVVEEEPEKETNNPKTGDNVAIYAALLAMGIAGIVIAKKMK